MDYFTLVVLSGILLYKSRGGNPIGINVSAKSDDHLSLKKKSLWYGYISLICVVGVGSGLQRQSVLQLKTMLEYYWQGNFGKGFINGLLKLCRDIAISVP